ncbi:MAG TPA: heparan-alpha-glucosaminide N-acetyltransferase domain-containing protein [Gemmatimonadaceae bacterium]|nr:heparan-alpha-glucosaminide N-acetyltransferase domain-containing protein [Gemmatimonadaceae bacterium]
MTTSAVDARVARYDNTTAGVMERVSARITSIDFVRGAVMVLMAIDHVRVYSGVPAGGPTPGVFFTRWITHFVAPGFVLLAGTSAYLHGRKLRDRRSLSTFLLVRGALLVLLELTVIRIAWTFNFDFGSYMLAGVIWMIGWCMILMAGAIHLPLSAIGGIGVAIVALHNLTDVFRPQLVAAFGDGGPSWLLRILYFGGEVRLGDAGPPLLVLYSLIPWIGVMMAGYAFGRVMEMPPERRRAICLRLGVALTVLFVALRTVGVYGDPRPWSTNPNPLGFLSTAKYPASLQFLLMTLGPLIVLLGLAERWRGRAGEIMETFGRVPMFYYLLHIPLIHVAAILVSLGREGGVNPWLFGNHPLAPPPVPEGYTWSLGLLYLVFAACVVVLYFPCRWFARLRATRRSRWLSYL